MQYGKKNQNQTPELKNGQEERKRGIEYVEHEEEFIVVGGQR